MWVRKVLLLIRCLVRGENENGDLVFVLYMKSLPPLEEADEAIGCVCMQ